jgi:hypothetical protein
MTTKKPERTNSVPQNPITPETPVTSLTPNPPSPEKGAQNPNDGQKTLSNLDKLSFRFPKFAAFLKKFAAKPGTNSLQDMALCAAVMLASGFYDFEGFFFPPLTGIIQGVLTFCVAAVWLWCFFLSGFWRRHWFLIFAAAYWVIPRLVIIREQTATIFEYSRYLAAAGEISLLLVEFPMKGLSALFNTSIIQATIALCAWGLALYLVGYIISRLLRRKVKVQGQKPAVSD